MSIYNAPQSGDFLSYLKYNAKAGRFFIKGEAGDVEVDKPTFVADLANIGKAWMMFAAGQAPDIKYWPALDQQQPQPTPDHKIGLGFLAFSNNDLGGVVKFETNSINTCTGISKLYDLYSAAAESKGGKLPVVQATGVTPVENKHGTNYEPKFEIVKWVDRPAEFNDANWDGYGANTVMPEVNGTPTPGAAPVAASTTTVSEF